MTTFEEAKDQVMRNHDFIPSQWQHVKNDKFWIEAAELYATAKAAQAWGEGYNTGYKKQKLSNPYLKQEKP